MPTISQKELDKLKHKSGVYQVLKKPLVVNSLKMVVTSVVESAFREYVRSHKGKHITQKLENESWSCNSEIRLKPQLMCLRCTLLCAWFITCHMILAGANFGFW